VAAFNPASVEALIQIAAGVACVAFAFKKGTTTGSPQVGKAKQVLRWLGPALIILGVFTFANGCTSDSGDAEAVVAGMKAKMKLPVQVDEHTRLDDVRAISKKELGYFLTLTRLTKAELVGNPIAKQLEAGLRSGACQNPNYVKILKAGIGVTVTYRTQDQADVARIVFVPKDCGF
jgi:hypothetical protein